MNDPLENAVFRNLNEVGEALYYLNSLVGMSEAKKENNILFLRLASDALKNDMMSHLMRVLDKTKSTGSFWYIYKREEKAIKTIVEKHQIDFSLLERIAKKNLNHIRNKSHFHIDRSYAYNQQDVWKEAGVSSKEIKYVLESLLLILGALFKRITGIEFPGVEYDGADAAAVVDISNTYIEIK